MVRHARAYGVPAAAAVAWDTPTGARKIAASTIYEWLAKEEKGGANALATKKRSDKGARKARVSRAFDQAFLHQFPDGARKLEVIAEELDTYARGLFASSLKSSLRMVSRLASAKLKELALKPGLRGDEDALNAACRVTHSWAQRHASYKKAALYRQDRKEHSDRHKYRVSRTYAGMKPMELVFLDVTPGDFFATHNGKPVRIRLIAAQDAATRRLFVRTAFFEKGRGVRQPDVVKDFIDMTQDPRWGLPRACYLDNGGEYGALKLIADAMELISHPDQLAFAERTVIHARAYNGAAKLIEGGFSRLAGFLAHIPGWIGGDRMRMKTHAEGRPAKPFPGTVHELNRMIAEAVETFNATPLDGAGEAWMRGNSPNDLFREAVENGWGRADFPRDKMNAVFSEKHPRTVKQGGIKIDNVTYTSEALQRIGADEKVVAYIPMVREFDAILIEDRHGKPLGVARPDTLFHPLDVAGARHARRGEKENARAIREMEKQAPKLNVHKELTKLTRSQPPLPVPERAAVLGLSETLADHADALATERANILSAGPPRKSRIEAREEAEQEEIIRRRDEALKKYRHVFHQNEEPAVAAAGSSRRNPSQRK